MHAHLNIPKRATALLLFATLLVAGCYRPAQSGSSSLTTQPTPAFENAQSDLPEWLQRGPADWSGEAWREYQGALIRSRAPLLRSAPYSAEELEVCTAEVEHTPGEYEDKLKDEWFEKWRMQIKSMERTGGCGCCNERYTVTAPKAAIAEFPPRPTCLPKSDSSQKDSAEENAAAHKPSKAQ